MFKVVLCVWIKVWYAINWWILNSPLRDINSLHGVFLEALNLSRRVLFYRVWSSLQSSLVNVIDVLKFFSFTSQPLPYTAVTLHIIRCHYDIWQGDQVSYIMSHDRHDTHMISVYKMIIIENKRFSSNIIMVAAATFWSGSRQEFLFGASLLFDASLLFGASLLLTQDWNQEI